MDIDSTFYSLTCSWAWFNFALGLIILVISMVVNLLTKGKPALIAKRVIVCAGSLAGTAFITFIVFGFLYFMECKP